SMVQHAGLAALEHDMSGPVEAYRGKRDRIWHGLADLYEIASPGGAFYLFPRAPRPSGLTFVEEAISQGLLIIPGSVFSRRDSHLRMRYGGDEGSLDGGVEVLRRMAADAR